MKVMRDQPAFQGKFRLPAKELETAQRLVGVVELDQLELLAQLFTDASYYVERNANPKILFLDVSIQMNQIFKRRQPNLQPRDKISLEERSTLGIGK
jgi:hypothetical protein